MALRTITGVVSSVSRDKTITVTVASRETHPLYGKKFTKTRKYTAHDPKNDARVGDKVIISETKPISKTKSFQLSEIVERSKGSIKVEETVIPGQETEEDEV